MATELHEAMVTELGKVVVPVLRSKGFRGAFPHFRRAGSHGVDLLTFQFDKHGGGFVVEIAQCPSEGSPLIGVNIFLPIKSAHGMFIPTTAYASNLVLVAAPILGFALMKNSSAMLLNRLLMNFLGWKLGGKLTPRRCFFGARNNYFTSNSANFL